MRAQLFSSVGQVLWCSFTNSQGWAELEVILDTASFHLFIYIWVFTEYMKRRREVLRRMSLPWESCHMSLIILSRFLTLFIAANILDWHDKTVTLLLSVTLALLSSKTLMLYRISSRLRFHNQIKHAGYSLFSAAVHAVPAVFSLSIDH